MFRGSAEVRRAGAEACAHLISEPSQPGGSTARSRRRDPSTRASERGKFGRAGPRLVRFARERPNAVTGRDVRSPDVWRRARSSAEPSAVQREEKPVGRCVAPKTPLFQWRSSLKKPQTASKMLWECVFRGVCGSPNTSNYTRAKSTRVRPSTLSRLELTALTDIYSPSPERAAPFAS